MRPRAPGGSGTRSWNIRSWRLSGRSRSISSRLGAQLRRDLADAGLDLVSPRERATETR